MRDACGLGSNGVFGVRGGSDGPCFWDNDVGIVCEPLQEAIAEGGKTKFEILFFHPLHAVTTFGHYLPSSTQMPCHISECGIAKRAQAKAKQDDLLRVGRTRSRINELHIGYLTLRDKCFVCLAIPDATNTTTESVFHLHPAILSQ